MGHKNKDLFSAGAQHYQQFRPSYPPALFAYISSLSRRHHRAWDCATGNGQAALLLANYFDQVIATDLSHQQIENAVVHEKIQYRVATAEHSGIDDQSIDLITVAQAFHWLDPFAFAQEVRRVAKKDGILAIWCYGLATISPAVDRIIQHLYHDILGGYWEPERKMVENNYRDVVLPFEPLSSATFPMSVLWTPEHLVGYLKTWSAYNKYVAKHLKDPLEPVHEKLAGAFSDESALAVTWNLTPRIWRI